MQEVLNKAYKGFMDVVDSFANSSAGNPKPKKSLEKELPVKKPDYAYPCDNYIDVVLENKLTRQTLQAIATKYYGNQVEEITSHGTKLTSSSFPRLWSNYHHCCSALSIYNQPALYITSKLSGINALSVQVDKEPIILLSYPSAIRLNDSEQRFILGHELGHIQLGHLLAHTVQGLLLDLNRRVELLGPIVNDLVDVPLNRWYRTSEFTADRAGYICSKDMVTIKKLLIGLEVEQPLNAFNQYKELSDAYPRMDVRLETLQKFVVTS